jgi:hypothetical protein
MAIVQIELDLHSYLDPIAETLEAFADGSVDQGDLIVLAEAIENLNDYLESTQGNIEIELKRVIGDFIANPAVSLALLYLARILRAKA